MAIELEPDTAIAFFSRACADSLRYGKDKESTDCKKALDDLKKAIELDAAFRDIARIPQGSAPSAARPNPGNWSRAKKAVTKSLETILFLSRI